MKIFDYILPTVTVTYNAHYTYIRVRRLTPITKSIDLVWSDCYTRRIARYLYDTPDIYSRTKFAIDVQTMRKIAELSRLDARNVIRLKMPASDLRSRDLRMSPRDAQTTKAKTQSR